MKEKEVQRERLRKELLSQDASLVGETEQYIGLLERMAQNIPEIQQDPLFFGTLKNKLRYHLITQYQPAPQPNSWQKFMLYGFPSLALGLALIYILPLPSLAPTPLSPDNIVFTGTSVSEDSDIQNIQGIAEDNDRLGENLMRQDKVISPPQYEATSVSNQRSAVPQDPKTSSIQDSSPEQQGGETLQDAQLLQEGDTSESGATSSYNGSFEHYSRGTSTKDWQLDYNVSYDQSDTTSSPVFLDGKLLIRSCNKVVLLDNPISLSRGPGLRGVRASDSESEISNYNLVLTIEQDNIVSIDGLEQLCP